MNTRYDMPDAVLEWLQSGHVHHIEYSKDHQADVLVLDDGRRMVLDMREECRYCKVRGCDGGCPQRKAYWAQIPFYEPKWIT